MAKLLASQALVIVLQYGILLIMCFFLYRVIKIVYLDFHSFGRSVPPKITSRIAKLIVITRGLLAGDQAEYLIGETINIGRGEYNEIIINETTVSHEHACISYFRNQYLLSDLNSTNGVLLNDLRLQQDAVLRKNDKIQIGSTIFQFEE